MESEIFDSDPTPASAEYAPTYFKVLDSDSCSNSKVNYLNFWQCLNDRIWYLHKKKQSVIIIINNKQRKLLLKN